MSLDFVNDWFIFDSVIDKETCNKIKKVAKGNWSQGEVRQKESKKITKEERLTGIKIKPKKDSKVRTSDTRWTTEQWIYDLIFPFMQEANKQAGWNLDVATAEPMQIARYKKGGFYTNHSDGLADSLSAYNMPDNSFLHGKVRKISMSMILNDDFEGGDLEFCSYFNGECKIIPVKLNVGNMIFFLSGVEHRVAPVTKGTRYSLVSWFLGEPVK